MARFDKLIAKTAQSVVDGVFADVLGAETTEVADFGPRLAPPDAGGRQLFYRAGIGSSLRGQQNVQTALVLTPTRLLWCDVELYGLGSVRKFKPAKGATIQAWSRSDLKIHITRPTKKDKIYNPRAVAVEAVQGDSYVSVYCALNYEFWKSKLS